MRRKKEFSNYKKEKKEVPSYKKVYSVYQYDRLKYAAIYKKIQKAALKYDHSIFTRTSPYRVLRLCYVKDEFNKFAHLGDEKHIFRYKALQNILKEIADYLIIAYEILPNEDVLQYLFKRTHILLYYQENYSQAELFETISSSIYTRIKVHITLLKCLQKGMEIEEAVNFTMKKHNYSISEE